MLKVRFFASIREALDCAEMDIAFEAAGGDLDALQARLVASGGDTWSEILGRENMIRAVNQQVIDGNCPLADGDEVAFFPPVTGG